jgi:hypothetical protein
MTIRLRARTRTRGRPSVPPTALIPAAARAPEVLTEEEAELSGEAIETFARAIGGRDALMAVLSVASSAPEIEKVVNYLLDPRYDRWTLRRLCTLAGITVAELFTAYRKALLTKAHLEATRIIAEKLPPIVDDVMERATPQMIGCAHCRGLAPPAGDPPCLFCHGSGQVRSEPELDRQKLALELGHLTEKKGGGLYIQQNQGVLASGAALAAQGSGALEQLQQAVGDLLFRPSRRRAMSPVSEPTSEPPVLPREEPPHEYPPPPQDEPDDPDASDEDEDEGEDEDEPDTAMR